MFKKWHVLLILCMGIIMTPLHAQDYNAEIDSLLAKMTLTEKIGQMVQINDFNGEISDDLRNRLRAGGIGSMLNEIVPQANLEIQRIAREESRLGIPIIMARDVIHGYRTIFPIPLGQAAAWDPELVREAAAIAAEEAAHAGFHWTFAPMMDITRDPRWGRIAEGFGEDPYLASKLAAAMTRGFQGDDLSAPNTIAACAKHFAGYGAVEGGRDYDTSYIPENLLRDLYLPPFKAAVDAGVATIMSSFNEINGVPATGNAFMLRHILRDEWGFKGFVVSDWNSMEEMINHGYCNDMPDVALKSIKAGVDMEMQSSAYADHLELLVKTNKIPQRMIDDAVRRILQVKFELGLFENPSPYAAALPDKPSEKALALAKKSALKSLVLLKNEDHVLPLTKSVTSIAVIGPMADDPYEMLGTWNRDGQIEDSVTPLAGLKALVGDAVKINHAVGIPYSRSYDTEGIAEAVRAARRSEVALLFVGEEAILSGEAHSRAYLDLPGAQNELIAAVAKTGKPMVVVYMAGRPLVMRGVLEKADAIIYAWHPGTMGGAALADVLFGVESPSGKLTITFPKAEGQIPVYYAHKMTGRPPHLRELTHIDDIPLRAYQSSLGDASRYLDIGYKPQFPFGFGLSFTTFKYDNLRISSNKLKLGEALEIVVEVSNTGEMAAEEIVQLYTRDLVGSFTRPVKELKGFQKVMLQPGETKTIAFRLHTDDLRFHNPNMEFVTEPGEFHLWVGGSSEADLMAKFEVVK